MKQAKKWHSLVCVPFTPLSNRSPYETMLEWWSSDGERVLVSCRLPGTIWERLAGQGTALPTGRITKSVTVDQTAI